MRICLVLVFLMFSLSGFSQQSSRQYLSGWGAGERVNWKFFCTAGAQSGKWTTIPVPSNWETEGFGTYNYGFAKDANRGKEQGLYEYDFTVPASQKGRSAEIVFEGVMTDAEVKINGKPAGAVHQGSYYIFRYDVSSLLNYGSTNKLEVKVSKHSANESVNQAERRGDFWIFGGIFRPVYLEYAPAVHINTIALNAKANGSFQAKITTNSARAASLKLRILDASNKVVATGSSMSDVIGTKLASPRVWTDETPNLYTAEFTLGTGPTAHIVKKKFGFRTVEVKERDGVYINGSKVKFKGVNRHSFWPETGRTLSRQQMLADALLIRSMNMNAVRMSHYPADEYFYDFCDSLGIYVMDELAGWHGNYDTATGTKLATQMIMDHMYHPSIIFWANGNEGGHNRGLDYLFTSLDLQKRPLIHPWEDFNGFDTQHYREYDYGVNNYMHGHSIVMPTEFLHGMYDGGHGAGLEDYWEAMWRTPNAAGGFLWDLADEGVVRRDKKDSIDTDGNHGADGIVGPHHEKEGSYYAIKEIWSPVYFEKKDITAAYDGSFRIENRFSFRNLKDCQFVTSYWKFERSLKGVSRSLFQGPRVDGPNVAPGGWGVLKTMLPPNWRDADVIRISALNWNNDTICTWSWPIHKPSEIRFEAKSAGRRAELVSTPDSVFQILTADAKLTINQKNGQLIAVTNQKGSIPFGGGPVAEEAVNNFSAILYRYDGDTLVLETTFDRKSSYNTLSWKFYPDGIVNLKVNYFPGAYFTSFQGINFNLPMNSLNLVSYEGRGPYRVWKNRMKGQQYGLYFKRPNDYNTGEPPFQYPEFSGYYANMAWVKFDLNDGQSFRVSTSTEDMFLRLYQPRNWDDPYHNLQPLFPSGDISFMSGISGIGTKTQKTETTGPMGMKSGFYDYEKDPRRHLHIELNFDFNPKP